MVRLWHVVLVAVVVLAVGTTAIPSSVSSDRHVSVPIVGDDEAYLRVDVGEPPTLTTQQTDGVALARVTNQFGPGVRLTVSGVAAADPTPLSVVAVPGPGVLDPGDSGTVRADVTCPVGERHTEAVSVTILATDVDGTVVTVDRVVSLTCAVPAPDTAVEATSSTAST